MKLIGAKGTPLDKQEFTWKQLVQEPISKLDDDAFTRVRVILMNGIGQESNRFLHSFARMNKEFQVPLAQVRRVTHHQQTLVNWLISADHSPLEVTLGYEQTAIEVTAALAQQEPDPYLAQVLRFGLLEDFDHLYRYSAMYDRLEGKDPNAILQSYSDILPGRPTEQEHRSPEDDLRRHYEKTSAEPITKLNALTIMAGENQTRDYYMNIGPTFSDPLARQLYAEIASIEEQHVTQYECIIDPTETWLEKWVMHEATEVYNYYSCMETESNPRIKQIWERFFEYELGQLQVAVDLFSKHEKRDPAEILPESLPDPIDYSSQRDFVRETLLQEIDLRADGTEFVDKSKEPERSLRAREQLNSEGSPTSTVAVGYQWAPGGELVRSVA